MIHPCVVRMLRIREAILAFSHILPHIFFFRALLIRKVVSMDTTFHYKFRYFLGYAESHKEHSSRLWSIPGLYSALLQEARNVIKTIPEKDIITSSTNPLALAVAKSVQKASWTTLLYKEFTLGHDNAS